MSSISLSSEPIYRTCYAYNSSTGKMEYRKYNYSEMLEKAASAPPRKGITYWEPDEYGRVYIDPKHPWQATLESEDSANVPLPDPASASLPAGGETDEKRRTAKKEEREAQEERLRMFREELERTAQQEALLHRLAQAVLLA